MTIICAGLSKTGTKSLARALRILGFKVYDYPEHRDFHMDEWLDVYCEGKSPDFTSMYKDVDAVTDVPTAFWFQELYEAFPDAKVILSLRDNEDVWVQSLAKQLELLGTAGGNRIVNILSVPEIKQEYFHKNRYPTIPSVVYITAFLCIVCICLTTSLSVDSDPPTPAPGHDAVHYLQCM